MLAGLRPDEQARDWRAYLSDLPRDDRAWVIEAEGSVAGFARTGACADVDAPTAAGEVHGLYVEPTRIGSGLGRRGPA